MLSCETNNAELKSNMIGITTIADEYILEHISHDISGNGALKNQHPLMYVHKAL